MKLTKYTKPQARNYQYDKCKAICSHKQMYDDKICEYCWLENEKEIGIK